ncbi:MAG: hypothetical protein HYV47_03510 [Candidatus Nealsonbacteria bacterium]|nr:hypothetical protein [Candidatus Nealsonbacteria bacterium]
MVEHSKILIIYGYHPKEIFAIRVGESVLKEFLTPFVKVVEYAGKQDEKSTCHLRHFIAKFGPLILPIVLHSDENFDIKIADINANAVIIYYARSMQEKEKILKFLFDFIFRYNKSRVSVIFDIVLTRNAKHSLVEIEFNPKMELKKAVKLVEDFSKYVPNI